MPVFGSTEKRVTEPGAVVSESFGCCVMKNADFPFGLKSSTGLLVMSVPLFVAVVPDGMSAPVSRAIEKVSTEFPPYKYKNLRDGSEIMPEGMKLLSSDGGVTSVGRSSPLAVSIVSIVSELAPLLDVVKTYANCVEAFAAGPLLSPISAAISVSGNPDS